MRHADRATTSTGRGQAAPWIATGSAPAPNVFSAVGTVGAFVVGFVLLRA